LVLNPSLISNATLAEVNYNYRMPLCKSHIWLYQKQYTHFQGANHWIYVIYTITDCSLGTLQLDFYCFSRESYWRSFERILYTSLYPFALLLSQYVHLCEAHVQCIPRLLFV
jgi:hypothetical protein